MDCSHPEAIHINSAIQNIKLYEAGIGTILSGVLCWNKEEDAKKEIAQATRKIDGAE